MGRHGGGRASPLHQQGEPGVTIKRGMIIAGSPRRVLDQLVARRDEIGHFGTLLMAGHDWDQPKLWRRSMERLAAEVMPRFSDHARANSPTTHQATERPRRRPAI